MKKALVFVFVLAAGLVVAAEDKKADDVTAKLKGKWMVTGMEMDGKKAPEDDFKGHYVTFDDKGNSTYFNGKETHKGTFKVDTSKKPAELDITPTDGPEKDKPMKMIFQLDGDNLKIAHGKDKRPTAFDGKEGGVLTLKRAKDDKKDK
jgi:uncharacterized protein (TIGR03067 family)